MPPRRYHHLALVPDGTQPNPECYIVVDDADTRAHFAAVEVADRLLTRAGVAGGQRVLVVGAGRGLILRAMAEHATSLEVAVVERTVEHAAELRAAGAVFDTCSLRLGVDLLELNPDGEPPYDLVWVDCATPRPADGALIAHAQRFVRGGPPWQAGRLLAVVRIDALGRCPELGEIRHGLAWSVTDIGGGLAMLEPVGRRRD